MTDPRPPRPRPKAPERPEPGGYQPIVSDVVLPDSLIPPSGSSAIEPPNHVTINCKGRPGFDIVCVDGKPIPRVMSVDFHAAFDGTIPVAKIEVIPDTIEVDALGDPLSCRHDGKEYVMVPRDE